MDLKIVQQKTHKRFPAPLPKAEHPGGGPSGAPMVALEPSIPSHEGVRGVREFISDVRGHRTRWPVLIVASMLTVCCIGFSASHILFKKARLSPAIPKEQAGAGSEVGNSPIDPTARKSDASLVEKQAKRDVSAYVKKPKEAFAFSFQATAEAAPEGNHRPGALQAKAAGANLGKIGVFAGTRGPHKTTMSTDPASADRPETLRQATPSSLMDQVHHLLASVDAAVENEDMQLFLTFLDRAEPDFFKQQERKARLLFKKFDQIDGSYSDVKIEVLEDDQVAVNLHCEVRAAFAKSGRPIELYNGPRQVTLKKGVGTVWKICGFN
jgi:hypothetical protein